MWLLSILDDHEVDQNMHHPLGEFGATTIGLFAGAANDKKKLRAKFLGDVMNVDPSVEPQTNLKAKICSRLSSLTCAWST